MDFRFVESGDWRLVHDALNGAGVVSMQEKWAELVSIVEETKVEVEIPEKKKRAPRKSAVKAKKAKSKLVLSRAEGKKESAVTKKKKPAVKKARVLSVERKPAAKSKLVIYRTVRPKRVTLKMSVKKTSK